MLRQCLIWYSDLTAVCDNQILSMLKFVCSKAQPCIFDISKARNPFDDNSEAAHGRLLLKLIRTTATADRVSRSDR